MLGTEAEEVGEILVLCVLVGIGRLDWEVGMLNHVSGSNFYAIFYFISISKSLLKLHLRPQILLSASLTV